MVAELTPAQRRAVQAAEARLAANPELRETGNIVTGMRQNTKRAVAALPDFAETIGDSVEFGARRLFNPDSLETSNPFQVDGPARQLGNVLDRDLLRDYEASGVYQPKFTGVRDIAAVEGGPVAKAFAAARMVGEGAITNAPLIVGTALAPAAVIPAVAASETQQLAEGSAQAAGRDTPNLEDFARGGGAAGANALLTRLGMRFGGGGPALADDLAGAALQTGRAGAVDGATGAGQGAITEAALGGDVIDGLLTGALVDGTIGGAINARDSRVNVSQRLGDEKDLGPKSTDLRRLAAEEEAFQRIEQQMANDGADRTRESTAYARTELDKASQTLNQFIREKLEAGELRDPRDVQKAEDILESIDPEKLMQLAERSGKNTKRTVTEDIREAVRDLPLDAASGRFIEDNLLVMDALGRAGIARNARTGPAAQTGRTLGTAVGSVGGFAVGSTLPGGFATGVPGAAVGARFIGDAGERIGMSIDRATGRIENTLSQEADARQRQLSRNDQRATDTGLQQVTLQNSLRDRVRAQRGENQEQLNQQRLRNLERQRIDPTLPAGNPYFEMLQRPNSSDARGFGIPPDRAENALRSLAQDGSVDIPTFRAALLDPEQLMGQADRQGNRGPSRGLELADMIARRDKELTEGFSDPRPDPGLAELPERMIPTQPEPQAQGPVFPGRPRFNQGVETVELPTRNEPLAIDAVTPDLLGEAQIQEPEQEPSERSRELQSAVSRMGTLGSRREIMTAYNAMSKYLDQNDREEYKEMVNSLLREKGMKEL